MIADSTLPTVVAHGFLFTEGPRWRDGRLWFSDIAAETVISMDPSTGERSVAARVPGRPSGLGWDPDGRLMVVSMTDRRLLRERSAGSGLLDELADVSEVQPCDLNDMIVDTRGRAYVGGFGFDLLDGQKPCPTVLLRVDPDGSSRVVADDLWFPNGMVLVDEDSTLIVAETFAARLTAFDIDADSGDLMNRRVWAQFSRDVYPDGICADVLGRVWTPSPATREILLVSEGGEIVERRSTGERRAMACVLGGVDRRTLFLCTALSSDIARCAQAAGARIEALAVETPGGGRP